MRNTKVYVHIGYGRTGTTWLQNNVFPKIGGIFFHGKTQENFPDWIIDWSYLDRFHLNVEKIKQIRENIYSCNRHEKILISSESFTQTGFIYDQMQRISLVVPDAKIIVTIRDPVEICISKYLRMLNVGIISKDQKLMDVCDFSNRPLDLSRRNRLYVNDFNYRLIVPFIQKYFGEKNVLVVDHELLARDPMNYVELICDFIGVVPPSGIIMDKVNCSPPSLPNTISNEEIAILRNATLDFKFVC